MFCCCAQEGETAAIVIVDKKSVWEASAVSQAEAAQLEQSAFEQAKEAAALEQAKDRQGPQEFHAVLKRGTVEEPFGWSPDALYVDSLPGGAKTAVAKYNASARAGEDIRSGVYITRVNGASGSAMSLAELLSESLQAQVTIQRPSTYVVELTRGDKPLGLDLNYSAKGTNLYIVSVRDGVVKQQAPEVSQGDRILNLDGHTLPPEAFISAMKGAKLKLTILKAPVV